MAAESISNDRRDRSDRWQNVPARRGKYFTCTGKQSDVLEKLYCKISDTHSPLFPIFNKEVQEEEAEP